MYCEECHQYPHADGCPNADPKEFCDWCDKGLKKGVDVITDKYNNKFCSEHDCHLYHGIEVRKED